jgi:hypothetical protein
MSSLHVLYSKHNPNTCRRAYVYNVLERQSCVVTLQQGPKVVCSMELDYREAKREAIRFCKGG